MRLLRQLVGVGIAGVGALTVPQLGEDITVSGRDKSPAPWSVADISHFVQLQPKLRNPCLFYLLFFFFSRYIIMRYTIAISEFMFQIHVLSTSMHMYL